MLFVIRVAEEPSGPLGKLGVAAAKEQSRWLQRITCSTSFAGKEADATFFMTDSISPCIK